MCSVMPWFCIVLYVRDSLSRFAIFDLHKTALALFDFICYNVYVYILYWRMS